MNWVRHGRSTTFETKSSYNRVARLGFKRRSTAVLNSNLIRSIEFGAVVARRLKRALVLIGMMPHFPASTKEIGSRHLPGENGGICR